MRSNKSYRWTAGSVASLSLIVLLGGTAGADTPSSAAGGTSGDTASQLEEVTVTATRREESIQKVPISINALSEADMAEAGIKSIADLAAVTPGLQFSTPNGFSSTIAAISIRGLNSVAGASPVGIYLDDMPIQLRLNFITNVGNPYPMIFDLNRVEVDRGPQGTLFGAGSEAGTVRYITNEPSLTNYSGSLHSEFAMTENGAPTYEYGAAVGGPIVEDTLGFRVSAWVRQEGGYVDRIDPLTGDLAQRDSNSVTKSAIRAALAWQTGDVRITPSVYFHTLQTNGSPFFFNQFSDPSQGEYANTKFFPEAATDSLGVASVKIEAGLPFANFTSTTSYIHHNYHVYTDESGWLGSIIGGFGNPLSTSFPTSPIDETPSTFETKVKGITQELRLASNQTNSFVTWVAGVFYDHRTQDDVQIFSSLYMDPTGTPFSAIYQHTLDDQIAGYAQGDIHVTQKLTATLGWRIADVLTEGRNNVAPGAFDVGLPALTTSTLRQTPSTPKIALSYQADSNNLFYTSVGKGFRVGGGNVPVPVSNVCNTPAPSTYNSDSLWSYEIGSKNTLIDGRLQVDTSVFHVLWTDVQQAVVNACAQGYLGNAGDAVSNGFDLALAAVITHELRFNVNVGFADAHFVTNVFAPNGTPLVLNGDKVGVLPLVNPPWNVAAALNYEVPLADGDMIHFRGEHQYNSSNPGPFVTQIPTSVNYSPQLTPNPATHLTNIRAGYTRGKLDVTLFVTNVFNSNPLLAKDVYTPNSTEINYMTFRPRTLGVSATFGF
jgi:iron complex outermembrane receptor protein